MNNKKQNEKSDGLLAAFKGVFNDAYDNAKKEKDLEVGKTYDLIGYAAILVANETGLRFFPLSNDHPFSNKIDGLIGFSLYNGHSFELLDTNDTLSDLITEDIHNLWLDAPKVVQDVLEKYMEEFRFDEFVSLEGERIKSKKV